MSAGQRLATHRVDPATTALVVVDVQNDFCHPHGACAAAGHDVTAAVEMVPRLQRLIAAAKAAGVRIVYIQTTHDASTDSPAWLARNGDQVRPQNCLTGSWGAEFYLVEPDADDVVVVKHRYSAFAGTNLDLVLRTAGVSALLLAGVATNICVESTLRDGLFADYHVTLVEDCCAAFSQEAHDWTVRTVDALFGVAAPSEEIAAAWHRSPQLA